MRIAIFNTVQLETAGGMEHFSIQTAAHLASLPGVQADCVTMDEAFNPVSYTHLTLPTICSV